MESKNILYISMYFHMFCEIITCLYIYLFSKAYDLFFVGYILIVVLLKLLFKYECIWSVFDKKLINPNYKLGSDAKYSPFRDLYPSKYIVILVGILIVYELFIIYYRNNNNIIKSLCIIDMLFLFFIEGKINKLII